MATTGKIPFLGFTALVKNLVWLGFGASSVPPVAPAYLQDFLRVRRQGRVRLVDPVGRWVEVSPTR